MDTHLPEIGTTPTHDACAVPPVELTGGSPEMPGMVPDVDADWAITAPADAGSEPDALDTRPTASVQVSARIPEPAVADAADNEAGNKVQVGERAYLLADTPPLRNEDVQRRVGEWLAGERIASKVVAAGLIMPTEEQIRSLGDPALRALPYSDVYGDEPLWAQARGLTESLTRVAQADMERNGLEGNLTVEAFAGYFFLAGAEPFHTDNYFHPSVRWTVAVGVGSTIGANGTVSKADTLMNGNIRTDRVEVGPGKQLEPVTFEEGTVVRFMNTGDIHAGPQGNGGRLLAVATLDMEPA